MLPPRHPTILDSIIAFFGRGRDCLLFPSNAERNTPYRPAVAPRQQTGGAPRNTVEARASAGRSRRGGAFPTWLSD
jgi:hypothetical protein